MARDQRLSVRRFALRRRRVFAQKLIVAGFADENRRHVRLLRASARVELPLHFGARPAERDRPSVREFRSTVSPFVAGV